MRVGFTKFDMTNVKVLLVKHDTDDTRMILKDGSHKGTCGKYVSFEEIIEGKFSENDAYEVKELANGDVLYRVVS